VYTPHAEIEQRADPLTFAQIERRLFAIQKESEEPDRYIEMPEKAYAHS
jgi:hypothetical protein